MIYKYIFKYISSNVRLVINTNFFPMSLISSYEQKLMMGMINIIIVMNSNKVSPLLDVLGKLMSTKNQMEHNNNDEQNKQQYQRERGRRKMLFIRFSPRI